MSEQPLDHPGPHDEDPDALAGQPVAPEHGLDPSTFVEEDED